MNIAFVLVSYGVDEPAGMERSIAALLQGLIHLGVNPFVIAAGPPRHGDDSRVIRLQSLQLSMPMTDSDLLNAVVQAQDLPSEIQAIIEDFEIEAICWVDVLWGLGLLAQTTKVKQSMLMIHVLGEDNQLLKDTLESFHGGIITPSQFVIDEASKKGYRVNNWNVVPNGLLHPGQQTPSAIQRSTLHLQSPVRVVARLGIEKGILPLIQAAPSDFLRSTEIILAGAGFEPCIGSQERLRDACQSAAATKPWLRILNKIGWADVPKFLAGASVTIVPSLAESFGLVALESMSVGTPVVAYRIGNLPNLIGSEAGILVEPTQGAASLWAAAEALLQEANLYQAMSQCAIIKAQEYNARTVARQWLNEI